VSTSQLSSVIAGLSKCLAWLDMTLSSEGGSKRGNPLQDQKDKVYLIRQEILKNQLVKYNHTSATSADFRNSILDSLLVCTERAPISLQALALLSENLVRRDRRW
jgi:hypothetical protein